MSLADRAYEQLRVAIEQGRYPEGGALPTQPALARKMGVSTVTLRQALERLAEEGYIEAHQGRGTFVRSSHRVQGAVLVADDDTVMRDTLKDALEHFGYQVETVSSAEEAVERISQHSFSHVLLDVRMGAMGGPQAAELISRIAPRTVVVFVTAYPIDLLEGDQAKNWPALVLRKPFDLDELQRVLLLKVR